MKILNFGSCNIDYVYSLDHIVEVGETQTSKKLEVFPGGKGLNQSVAIAKAGAMVYHAGCIGFDGQMLTDVLTANGVDVSYIKKTDKNTGHAIIQVDNNGENSIFIYPGSNEMLTRDYIDSVLNDFGKGDIILLQNEINDVCYIVQKAFQKGMCIIFNPSPVNDKIFEIDFSMLSYIILNEVEVKAISKCDVCEDGIQIIKEKYPNLKIVLTLGKNGSVYTDGECRLYQSAFLVEVVDTTAAGDTFTGYFVAGLSKKTEYQKIMRVASAASAIAVSTKGASPSIPSKDKVLSVIKTLKENKVNAKSEYLKQRIETYIENNLKTASVNELAKTLGYSAVYTGTLVKKLTNCHFTELLQNKRCDVAARRLLETDLPVETVISEVGYENAGFFRKAFKERYGKNPLEFKKEAIIYDKRAKN